MLVVVSARVGVIAGRGWVRRDLHHLGGRASTVLATYSTPASTRAPMPMTARDAEDDGAHGAATRCRSAMPQARGKDLELVAVLRDGPPGQRDSLLRRASAISWSE